MSVKGQHIRSNEDIKKFQANYDTIFKKKQLIKENEDVKMKEETQTTTKGTEK